MNKNKFITLMAGAGLIVSSALAGTAFAQTISANIKTSGNIELGDRGRFRNEHGPIMASEIFGTVTAINGNSLTVTSNNGMWQKSTNTVVATTTYIVDASNAMVYKNSTTTVGVVGIATGDKVIIQGSIVGTNVVATTIHDGIGMMGRLGRDLTHGPMSARATSTSMIQGNGEPVIAGNVSAISGTTLTVTTKSNITYTVNAASTTIVKNGTSTAFANIATGDSVIIQGAVNGTSVTASSIIDQQAKVAGDFPNIKSSEGFHIGVFFGGIGNFFRHLFGF